MSDLGFSCGSMFQEGVVSSPILFLLPRKYIHTFASSAFYYETVVALTLDKRIASGTYTFEMIGTDRNLHRADNTLGH